MASENLVAKFSYTTLLRRKKLLCIHCLRRNCDRFVRRTITIKGEIATKYWVAIFSANFFGANMCDETVGILSQTYLIWTLQRNVAILSQIKVSDRIFCLNDVFAMAIYWLTVCDEFATKYAKYAIAILAFYRSARQSWVLLRCTLTLLFLKLTFNSLFTKKKAWISRLLWNTFTIKLDKIIGKEMKWWEESI